MLAATWPSRPAWVREGEASRQGRGQVRRQSAATVVRLRHGASSDLSLHERNLAGEGAGGLRWVPNGLGGIARLIYFLFNGSPLKQFKWDGPLSPTPTCSLNSLKLKIENYIKASRLTLKLQDYNRKANQTSRI